MSLDVVAIFGGLMAVVVALLGVFRLGSKNTKTKIQRDDARNETQAIKETQHEVDDARKRDWRDRLRDSDPG